jgi:glycerol-3-phosphate cytidylyltransferase
VKRVLTIGTFDTPHLGHAYLFKECEAYGELTVGVNSDEFVEAYKGQAPLYEYEERARLIAALGYAVVKNTSAGRCLIDEVHPDVLAIGGDWAERDYYGQIEVDQQYLNERRIAMLYIPRVETLSSTELKSRVQGRSNRDL